jgi:hypothetical protein
MLFPNASDDSLRGYLSLKVCSCERVVEGPRVYVCVCVPATCVGMVKAKRLLFMKR